MGKLKYYLSNIFAACPFVGNKLAVSYKPSVMSTELMQKIDYELNLSEATFVFPTKESKNDCVKSVN